MAALVQVTDHVERGLSNLLEQYQGKPRLEGWVSSTLEEVQELTNAAWGVLMGRLIDTAVGEQLTVLGRIVGERTRPADDEVFRVLIRARVRVNRSHGRPNDVLEVLAIIASVDYRMDEYPPLSMLVELEEEPAHDPRLIWRLLQQTKAASVWLGLVSPTALAGEQFLWCDVDDPDWETTDTDEGFGDADDEDTYGLLSDAVVDMGLAENEPE